MEAYPLVNQEAVTVAEVLIREFISRFGVPLILHFDQGQNFESAVSEMCKLLGVTKIRTTPLHPQSDGMVECFNRILEAQLSKFVEDHQQDLDLHLPLLLMAYRTAIYEATGYTPASLMLRRDLRLPFDLLFGRPRDETPTTTTTFSEELGKRPEQVQEFVYTNLKVATDRMKERYDSMAEDTPLEKGQPVWVYIPQLKKGISQN